MKYLFSLKLYLVVISILGLISCTGGNETAIEFKDENSALVVNAASPDAISDLIYWYNSSKTQVVSVSNKAVSLLPVKNYGPTMTVMSGKTGPAIVDWGDNIYSGLKFSSSDSTALYLTGSPLTMSEESTFVFVVKDITSGDLLKWSSDLNSVADSAIIRKSSTLDALHEQTTSDYSINSASLDSYSSAQVITIVFSSSSNSKEMYIYLNGFRIKTTTGLTTGSPLPYAYNLRHLILGLGETHGNFTLGEFTTYKRALGPREVYAISKGFGSKWNIPISTTLNAEIIDDKIHDGDKVLTYESIKRDILTPKGCLNCHNNNLVNAGVNFSSFDTTINSISPIGRVAIPGQPDSSRLYLSVSGTSPTMPQLETQYGGFLSTAELSDLRQWILEGLKKDDLTPPLPLE